MSYKRIKIIGLALVAVLALSAVAVASASAKEPRWKVSGAFLGNNVGQEVIGTSGISILEVPELGLTIECSADTVTGEIVGSAAENPGKDRKTRVTYTGCKVVGFESTCAAKSPSTAAGTIQTELLTSRLVWLSKTAGKAGDLLLPAEEKETGTFVTIEIVAQAGKKCLLARTAKVTGGVIGEVVQAVGTEATVGELNFPSPAIGTYFTGASGSRTEHKTGLKFGENAATYKSLEKITIKKAKEEEALKTYGVFDS